MLIGVDGNEANVKEKVGVSVYTFKLLEYFEKKAEKNLRFIIFLKNKPNNDLPKDNKYFNYEVVRGDFFWSQFFLPLRLFKKRLTKNKIDVFFSPAHYSPRFCLAPTIVAIHDLSYFYYPDEFLKNDLYKLKNWTKYSVNRAKKIIAVSNTTKKDLIKFYQLPGEKIEVVYNGFEKNVKSQKSMDSTMLTIDPERKSKESKVKSSIKNLKLKIENYILYVGTLQPRKNIDSLINAFAQFIKLYPEFKLIITGKKGWLYEKIFQQVKTLGLKSKIIFTNYVNDQQLTYLYKNAYCFVLPSLYEGFGIPILEAMSYDCPVISSFSSSLPEIGGDACLYFDPKDVNDLIEKMTNLIQNHNLRQELIIKGRERVKLFSWEKCGKKTLEIIRNINQNDKNN